MSVGPTPGERFGPYDIVGPLGSGGMGIVYRARDSRLGRDVALKTLPASSLSDPVRLQRFEAEARAALEGGVEEGGVADGARDPLFREAAELCIQNQSGSTSLLQRRLGIGYGRAARVIDQLADAGILDPKSGPKGREVRVGLEDLDRICGMRE